MVMFWLLHHVESCVCLFRRFGGISEHIHDCLHQASVFVNIVGVAIHALRCYRAAVVAMPVRNSSTRLCTAKDLSTSSMLGHPC